MDEALLEPPATTLAGAELIAAKVRHLPHQPGVYRMLGAKGDVLYVGKAKDLKKRVAAYAKAGHAHTARIMRMVALTREMEFVTTASEVEALLLEANLIKRLKPAFNIVLRDDKSFPYVFLKMGHDFPQIGKHRGAKKPGTEYFGPFASAGAVNQTLNALLRAFPLRNCTDQMFESRSRPCLQHQIKRCSAPCVGRIDAASYQRIVDEVRTFLAGRSHDVQDRLKAEMEDAAERLDFEQAAVLRDRLKALAHITANQGINTDTVADADVIAAHASGGQVCVQVFFYRGGKNYGNKAFYPTGSQGSSPGEVLETFAAQFYSDRAPPRLVLLNETPPQLELLSEALSARAEAKVRVLVPQRGAKRDLVEIARSNAEQALARKLAEGSAQAGLLRALAERLELAAPPARIEVYDNSHIQGRHAVGSFVVAGAEGFQRQAYRTFTIKDEATVPGDDFAMMREVFRRRFARLVKEDPERDGGSWPDLVVIDGGQGQLSAVRGVLDGLGVADVALVAVAKGPDRNAGREVMHMPDRPPLMLESKDPVLYFIQRLRDEAHRFAVSTHRAKRGKAMQASPLDSVPGIGAKRKKALLLHFGSARGVQEAGLKDLEQVPGISQKVARHLYDHFHEQG
ncbi:MAG: excinuclease ABC subunit UvrC [Geminicoccaceae bacterium]|nr:MAG: excinuclease ABC subunit UvrC [Geminicoccaceae bacterium]